MRDVWSRAIPQTGDHLRDSECKKRAESGSYDAMAPVDRPQLAAGEEQSAEQGEEEKLGIEGEEPEYVLEAVVMDGVPVQGFVQGQVQGSARVR